LYLVCILTVSPNLVQDAHIARSESFLFALFGLLAWIASARMNILFIALLAGLVAGVGTATKFTFLSTGLVLAPVAFRSIFEHPYKGAVSVFLGIAAMAVGFAIAAPYVLINLDAYLAGVDYLRNQYTEGHPPHSYKQDNMLQSVQHVMVFIGFLYGPIILLPVLLFLKPYSDLTFGLASFGLLNILYFATVPVFFERNISLALTALLTSGVMLGARHRSVVLIGTLCSFWMLYWSIQISGDSRERGTRPDRHADWATTNGLQGTPIVIEFASPVGLVENCTDRIGLMHFGDDYSASSISQLERAGHTPIAVYQGRYRQIPTSTLHTYLDADIYYYQCGPGNGT
jgi:hypothetical protein